jgi:hypothetical protein
LPKGQGKAKAPGQTRGKSTAVWNHPGHLKPSKIALGTMFTRKESHYVFEKKAAYCCVEPYENVGAMSYALLDTDLR